MVDREKTIKKEEEDHLMEQKPIQNELPPSRQSVVLDGTFRGKYRVFAVFLICCALLVAAFAFSAVWMNKGGESWFSGVGEETETEKNGTAAAGNGGSDQREETETPSPLPENSTPVISMDLAYLFRGTGYLHNDTRYSPDVEALLALKLKAPTLSDRPLVLILHTHTSESYLPTGAAYITAPLGDLAYSREEKQNVLSVGETLCRALNEKGITALHCTVMHDDPTLSGSYRRSEETVKRYLEEYPSIEYVIDLHRDAVMTSDGSVVRAVGYDERGEAVAQIMPVVGTDGNGTEFLNWEENLAFALQLREVLNEMGSALCRPVYLRNESFGQELAKHSLLLEIGTAANSIEEANRAALVLAEALARMIYSLA